MPLLFRRGYNLQQEFGVVVSYILLAVKALSDQLSFVLILEDRAMMNMSQSIVPRKDQITSDRADEYHLFVWQNPILKIHLFTVCVPKCLLTPLVNRIKAAASSCTQVKIF